jgi:hypothetical protein
MTTCFLLYKSKQLIRLNHILTALRGSCGSSVSVVTMQRAGRPEFDSWQEQRTFLLATASRPVVAYFKLVFRYFCGGTEKNTAYVTQDTCLRVRNKSSGVSNTRKGTTSPAVMFGVMTGEILRLKEMSSEKAQYSEFKNTYRRQHRRISR